MNWLQTYWYIPFAFSCIYTILSIAWSWRVEQKLAQARLDLHAQATEICILKYQQLFIGRDMNTLEAYVDSHPTLTRVPITCPAATVINVAIAHHDREADTSLLRITKRKVKKTANATPRHFNVESVLRHLALDIAIRLTYKQIAFASRYGRSFDLTREQIVSIFSRHYQVQYDRINTGFAPTLMKEDK